MVAAMVTVTWVGPVTQFIHPPVIKTASGGGLLDYPGISDEGIKVSSLLNHFIRKGHFMTKALRRK